MHTEADKLKYKLSELANSELKYIYGGLVEIYWQDQNENEFSTDESVITIAAEALARITELEAAINQTIGWAEETGSIRLEDGGETLRLLRGLVSYQPPLQEQGQS